MARDFETPVEGGRTRGARTHSRTDVAKQEARAEQPFAGWYEIDLYMRIPVFARNVEKVRETLSLTLD